MSAGLARRVAEAGLDWIIPDWEVSPRVHALSTTRHGGVSSGAQATLDLGPGSLPAGVAAAPILENRRTLAQFLPAPPVWLAQRHEADIAQIDASNAIAMVASPPAVDAAVTREPNIVLCVRTADCLPVMFADRAGTTIGIDHAGWRGLAAGILEATVATLRCAPTEIVAWLGPAIGPCSFEVGRDVYDAFCAADADVARYFRSNGDSKWFADLYGIARTRLARLGVRRVTGGDYCTMLEAARFFSYRRERDTGRMATLIWIEAERFLPLS
ncbi:MAG: peptidoglycan editing factor PgeF [Casimicrobiaceae bacterium]